MHREAGTYLSKSQRSVSSAASVVADTVSVSLPDEAKDFAPQYVKPRKPPLPGRKEFPESKNTSVVFGPVNPVSARPDRVVYYPADSYWDEKIKRYQVPVSAFLELNPGYAGSSDKMIDALFQNWSRYSLGPEGYRVENPTWRPKEVPKPKTDLPPVKVPILNNKVEDKKVESKEDVAAPLVMPSQHLPFPNIIVSPLTAENVQKHNHVVKEEPLKIRNGNVERSPERKQKRKQAGRGSKRKTQMVLQKKIKAQAGKAWEKPLAPPKPVPLSEKPSKPKIRIPYSLTPEEEKHFVSVFGDGYEFGDGVHDHGLAAAFRFAAQRDMESRLGPKLVDVYGSARLQSAHKHSIMPLISAHDGIRNRPKKSCLCDPLLCTHHELNAVAFCVDALYYMNPKLIKDLCVKFGGKFYTLHHSFAEVFASNLCGTYNYFVNGDIVNVAVGKGEQKHLYQHPSCEWLRKGTWCPDGVTITYEVVTTYGPMELGCFQLGERTVRPNWSSSIIGLDLDRSLGLGFERSSLTSAEYKVYLTKKKKHAVLDAQFYRVALSDIRMKEFNDKTVRSLISRLKRESLNDRYVVISKLFPLLWEEHFENTILAAFQTRGEASLSLYDLRLAANGVAAYNKALSMVFKPQDTLLTKCVKGGLAVGAFCVGVWGFKQLMTKHMHRFTGNTFIPDVCCKTDFGTVPTDAVREPEVYRIGRSNFIKRVPGLRVNGYIHQRKSVIRRLGDCGCAHPMDRERGIMQLVAVSGYDGMSYTGCCNNVNLALRARFMSALNPVVTEKWEQYEVYLKRSLSFLKKNSLPLRHHHWFNKWKKKFPLVKQEMLQRARDNPMPVDRHTFNFTVCCKYEVTVVKPKFKPRAFFPANPHNLVRNGPAMNCIKHQLVRLCDGKRSNFIFAPCRNNLKLGKLFSEAMEARGLCLERSVSMEIDLSKAEATMRGPFLVLAGDAFQKLGLSRNDRKFITDHVGFNYKTYKNDLYGYLAACLLSGVAYTTPLNSVVFMLMIMSSSFKYNLESYVAVFGGDDMALYFNRRDLHKVWDMINDIKLLGLSPEALYHDNVHGARIFAGRFLTVSDERGRDVVVHCPLIGRCLVKGLCCKYKGQPIEPWLRDVSECYLHSWSHVPILNEVNLNIYRRYRNVKGRCTISVEGKMIDVAPVKLKYNRTTLQQLATVYQLSIEDLEFTIAYVDRVFSEEWIGVVLESETLETICDMDLK
jgi:hypothetical protein